jgi:hypothetical protein
MNSELKRMLQEEAMVCSQEVSQHLPGATEKP